MSKLVNRLEFLRSLGRGSLMLGLAAVGAGALHGKKDVSECFNHNYCSSCWAHTGCTLPEKQEITENLDEVSDERNDQSRSA